MGNSFSVWWRHKFGLQAAPTQLSDAERAALVRHAAGRRRAVEIGVYFGASTALLREALAPDGELVGIDPFFPGRLGVSFQKMAAKNEIARRRGAAVRLVRALSQVAGKTWETPIDFLFIDADHSWAGIDGDWKGFAGWVEPGGLVALHDSFPIAGRPPLDSVRYFAEVVAKDERFEQIDRVDTLAVLRRRGAS